MSTASSSQLLLLTALQVAAALVFLKGFLLTRVELPDVSQQCAGPSCSSNAPPYQKAVVLIVDAVRYDFLCGGRRGAEGYVAPLLPKTLQWVQAGAGAAVASRFTADTPTITMSRLKALLTGGLPTFLDVGQSFSASAISEDNLLQQLLARNKTLVMMGDDTWMQLAEGLFAEAYPYPSFNVHDLHTVDNGVWQHLVPLLERPSSWDVLIAHYLGVDHAGHTYGVNSRQMRDKLAQMDDQVSTVIERLVSQAGPGGAYADTLLLVLSDHGQTQGGDHGGGTPDETDSVLVAMSLRHMNATLQRQRGQQQQQQQQQQQTGQEEQQQQQGAEDFQGSSAVSKHVRSSSSNGALLLRLMTAAGYVDVPHTTQQAAEAAAAAGAGATAAAAAATDLQGWLVCGNTVPQIDLTPLLSHLLGVPAPFANLGKVPPHLFATLTAAAGGTGDGDPAAWLPGYAAALAANAQQVHVYLNRYAQVGRLPADQLAAVNQLYAALQQQQQQMQQQQEDEVSPVTSSTDSSGSNSDSSSGGSSSSFCSSSQDDLEGLVAVQLHYLAAAADLARRRFTLFQQGPIWAGCGLAVLVLLGQLWYLRHMLSRQASSGGRAQQPWSRTSTLFAALAAFHALGLFSVGLLMGEGRLVCVLLAATTLLLLRATLRAILQARKAAQAAAGQQQQQQPVGKQLGNGHAASMHGAADTQQQQQQQCRGQQQVQLVVPAVQVYWASWQPTTTACRAAASLLVCNVALQLLGLIDRYGQDPHDKTQPTSELLVGPGAAWQQAAYAAFVIGPLVLIWCVFGAASRLLEGLEKGQIGAGALGIESSARAKRSVSSSRGGSSRGGGSRGGSSGPSSSRSGGGCSNTVLRCLKAVCALQLVCLGLFWVAQLYGQGDTTLCDQGQRAWTAVLQSPAAGAAAAAIEAALPGLSQWQPCSSSSGGGSSAQLLNALGLLPLRLLLPRVVYVGALAVLVVAVLLALLPRFLVEWQPGFPCSSKSSSSSSGGAMMASGADASGVAAAEAGGSRVVLLLWLCAVLCPPLVLVLGFKGPATLLLALLQAVGLCRLLRLQVAAGAASASVAPSVYGAAASSEKGAAAGAGDNADVGSCCSVVGAGAWGLMALQLFFCSGHFCEFSGLQYASAFIGFDDMAWYTSGTLLLLNTCGFLFLGALSLPVLLAACAAAGPAAAVAAGPAAAVGAGGGVGESSMTPGGDSSQQAAADGRGESAGSCSSSGSAAQLLLPRWCASGLWVINSMRFAALVVSLVSAAVQQQHILLWAIFAPKLVFELWFMAVTAAGQLLVVRLLPLLLGVQQN